MTRNVREEHREGALSAGELLRALAIGERTNGTVARERDGAGTPTFVPRAWASGAMVTVTGVALVAGGVIERSWHNRPVNAMRSGLMETQGADEVTTSRSGMRAFLGAAAAATINAGVLAQEAVQWRVESGGNGHWYRFISNSDISWQGADEMAEAEGGHLADLESPAEGSWIVAFISAQPQGWVNIVDGPFLGASQSAGSTEPTNGWSWTSGRAWSGEFWRTGEPNNTACGEPENVAALVRQGSSAAMNDVPARGGVSACGHPLATGLLIEWSADCNSDGIVDYGQIRDGQLPDANANNIPDACECESFPGLPSCRCVGDIVADRVVNGADLGTLLFYWGPRTAGSFSIASDLNNNGTIDGADLGMLLSNWGECEPVAPIVPAWATLIESQPDPAVVTNAELRMAIAATGLAWRVRDTGTGIEMLLVPPGAFDMGCSPSLMFPCSESELPIRQVSLTRPFYLARHELTQFDWRSVTGSNPSYFTGFPDSDSRPVEQVSWNESTQFAASIGMRLPTEAEWEFACRAGTSTAFFNGSNDDSTLGDIAWIGSNDGDQIRPVGQKSPNRLGFFDMLGNVWEWVDDFNGVYPGIPEIDPAGPPSGTQRILRGHSCFDGTYNNARSSSRDWGEVSLKHAWTGFRVARNP